MGSNSYAQRSLAFEQAPSSGRTFFLDDRPTFVASARPAFAPSNPTALPTAINRHSLLGRRWMRTTYTGDIRNCISSCMELHGPFFALVIFIYVWRHDGFCFIYHKLYAGFCFRWAILRLHHGSMGFFSDGSSYFGLFFFCDVVSA